MKSNTSEFVKFLTINKQLFGIKSHIKLAPRKNGIPFRSFTPTNQNIRKSAVMVLLTNKTADDFKVLLTLRSDNLKSHSGQISFPGGRIEQGESPVEAALRETSEEISLPQNEIQVLAQISELYVPPSNSLIFPFVGITNFKRFIPNNTEVQKIIEVPFSFLLEENNLTTIKRNIFGEVIDIPCWDLNKKEVLWGATAMILSELIDLYRYFEKMDTEIINNFSLIQSKSK